MSVRTARRGTAGAARRRLTQAAVDLLRPVVTITQPDAQSTVADTFVVGGTFIIPLDVAPTVAISSPPAGEVVGDAFTVAGTFALIAPVAPVDDTELAYPSDTTYPSSTLLPEA